MPSVVFSSSSISPTNSYRKRGNTVTASFYQSSGSLPGAGSSIQSVVVSFSDITVYSQTTAGFSTNYFEVSLDLDSAGSQTQVAYSVSSALLNFTGGSITFTVWGGGSSTSNVLKSPSPSTTPPLPSLPATSARPPSRRATQSD